MYNRIKIAGAIAATMIVAGPAYAGCNAGTYCSGSSSSSAVSTTSSSYYPSGSISNEYSGGSVELYGFSGQLDGLGANESLRATDCPVSVYNPGGAKVLGCYNVVKPVPRVVNHTKTYTTYYQVVRPIIYVRYPVPVGVPVYNTAYNYNHHSSYSYHNSGSWGHGGGGGGCGGNSSRYGTANYGGSWGCR